MSCKNEYDFDSIQKRPLKFKGGSGKVEKKKKKKKKKDKKKMEQVRIDAVEKKTESEKTKVKYDKLTPAERRFKEKQDKRQTDRIIKRASTTHRDRVEEFNRNLDALSEHYDIPKVSWTK
ncbi:protein FAM32A-like [Clavelina lepadiformis]|uniref:protein FAM32A-like n=1 Tax=Clavelina lepadiformis TaxID=159417 RepID=UPI00404360D8